MKDYGFAYRNMDIDNTQDYQTKTLLMMGIWFNRHIVDIALQIYNTDIILIMVGTLGRMSNTNAFHDGYMFMDHLVL